MAEASHREILGDDSNSNSETFGRQLSGSS